jgi:hypothetical protein
MAIYALNILERKRRLVVRPETFSQVPDDPLCDLFGQEHEHPSNKPGAGLESAVLEPLSPLYQC